MPVESGEGEYVPPVIKDDPTSGGGGGGGGGGTTGGQFDPSNYPDPQESQQKRIPDGAEIWKVHDTYYVVYYIPDTEPPVPLGWEASEAEVQAIFGPGVPIKIDKWVEPHHLSGWGFLDAGDVEEIEETAEHPFEAWADEITERAEYEPWLTDPEVLAVIAEAMIEGDPVDEWQLKNTSWFRDRTDAEVAWALLSLSDPAQAQRTLEENRLSVAENFRNLGITGVDEAVVNYIADQKTKGIWGTNYMMNQIHALADPYSGREVDAALSEFLSGGGYLIDSTQDQIERVRQLVATWLGPVYGNWNDDQIAEWAGTLRNREDGEERLIAELRAQRLSAFPGYTDPNRTYNDIAQPWRSFWSMMWGIEADETDPFFLDVVNMNNAGEAAVEMRREGLTRGVKKVSDDFTQSALASFSQIRRPIY